MITREDFIYLTSSEARELISRHKGEDATKLALKGVPRLVCTAVKSLERCRKKLPDHYRVAAIVDDLAYEQSSSSATASTKHFNGESCLDLTLGLGSDSYALSKQFGKVTSLERSELYAEIGRYNMSLLGADNIEIINCSAEEYLANCKERFDLIYVDPARRDEQGRTALFEECSPNILELKEEILRITDRLVIKASPLFDADMAERLFSSWGALTITATSLLGECKELTILIDRSADHENRGAVNMINSRGEALHRAWPYNKKCELTIAEDIEAMRYLYIPDVVFYKMRRLDKAVIERCSISCPEGVLLSEELYSVAGGTFKIVKVSQYTPKKLKSAIKKEGKERATIYRKGCRASGQEIKKALALKDGNRAHFVFTSHRGSDIMIEVTPL